MSLLIEGVVLDTSAAIAHLRRQFDVSGLVPRDAPLFLPVVALGELYEGAERSARPAYNRHEVEIFLHGVSIIVPDSSVAECYGRIAATLARAGTPIAVNDLWIAAAALAAGLPLAARDAHFDRIPGLQLRRC